ncbi:MAG: ABC transporter permease [candidate division Zixibacteria bacterium]|nr:ABC transporter permease [candidate division Zixibacteria bacterium]
MGKIITLALKDLKVLSRDKGSVFWVLFFPLLVALFFGSIFSGGGGGPSGMKIAVVDTDSTDYSIAFAEELSGLSSLQVSRIPADSAIDKVRRGKLSAVVTIKKGFGQTLGMFTDSAMIEIGVDPSRKMTVGYLQGLLTQSHFRLLQKRYADPESWRMGMDSLLADTSFWEKAPPGTEEIGRSIIGSFKELSHYISTSGETGTSDTTSDSAGTTAEAKKEDGFNLFPMKMTTITNDEAGPRSSFEITFPSSMLWALIGIASAFAVSIVKERTAGTFLRLRLAPISRMQILAGKGLACFLSSLVVTIILLLFGNLVFGVRIGNPVILLIAVIATSYCFVGISMLVSTIGKTEESVGGASWGILLVSAMTGGGMIPLMFMPGWLVTISHFSPVKWGILAIEGGVWRNFTFSDMLMPLGMLIGIGTLTFAIGATILSRRDS